jgi:hypothetical protein
MRSEPDAELTDAWLNVLRALLDGPKTRRELRCYAPESHLGELIEGEYIEPAEHGPERLRLAERGQAAWLGYLTAAATRRDAGG